MRHKSQLRSTAFRDSTEVYGSSDKVTNIIHQWFLDSSLWYSHKQPDILNKLFTVSVVNVSDKQFDTTETRLTVERDANGSISAIRGANYIHVQTYGDRSIPKEIIVAVAHNVMSIALSEINNHLFPSSSSVGIENLSPAQRWVLNQYILAYVLGMRPVETKYELNLNRNNLDI